jgi:23S rRNA (pseudouridine1915-N3)-methyltransferase
MQMRLIAVGHRQPAWVETGYLEYASRLPKECTLTLTEVAAGRRAKGTPLSRILAEEGERIRTLVPPGARLVALDERGKPWSTRDLALRLQDWLMDGRGVALCIGGPDGLAPALKAEAEVSWSLSPLTLPHGLVRVIVAEAIYRAWSLLQGHPYHRAG